MRRKLAIAITTGLTCALLSGAHVASATAWVTPAPVAGTAQPGLLLQLPHLPGDTARVTDDTAQNTTPPRPNDTAQSSNAAASRLANSYRIPPELVDPEIRDYVEKWQVTPEDALSAAAISAHYLGESQTVEAILTQLTPQRAAEIRAALQAIDEPQLTPAVTGLPSIIVVLGNGLEENGRVHPELAARLRGGLELAGVQPSASVVVTGGNTGYGYNEAEAMRNWLVRHGLPAERIIEEKNAWSTVSNAWHTRDVLDARGLNPQAITVVTSDYHVRRGVVDFTLAFGSEVTVAGLGTPADTELTASEERLAIYRDAVSWYVLPDAIKADGLPPFMGQNPERKPATEPASY